MEESETKWNTPLKNYNYVPLDVQLQNLYSYKPAYKEGFDIFSSDYFRDVSRKMPKNSFLEKIIKKITDFLKKLLSSPSAYLDKGLESFIKTLLLLLMDRVDCDIYLEENKNKLENNQAANTFTWANGELGLLNEGFSMKKTPDLINTIQSFMENHIEIEEEVALINYYIRELNSYEKTLGRNMNSDELFVFNNEFDNKLASEPVRNTIETIAKTITKSSYKNSMSDYLLYLQKDARFSFNSTTEFKFFLLNTDHFPFPMDQEGFFMTQEYDRKAVDYIKKLEDLLAIPSVPPLPPLPPDKMEFLDPNYAYTTNLETQKIGSIASYLKYISIYFSTLLYYKRNQYTNLTYPSIQANFCSVYITYLNAVEFQKYRMHSSYLTEYELAMFNHLFFICIQQNTLPYNVYNISKYSENTGIITMTPSNMYINLSPVSIYNIIKQFCTEINNRVIYLSDTTFDDYQPLPLDSKLIIPEQSTTDMSNNVILLNDYILNNTSYTIDVPPEIREYYIPDGTSECESQKKSLDNEAKRYANIIKYELYRMLTIPIILYIFYNFYYLFFFKDCYSPVYKTDENGTNTYNHTCEGGEKGGCFTPNYPDWETIFHSIESHKSDYIFEFIFKPIKMFYTLLNSFKTIFRKQTFGLVLKDELPYLFFLFSFYFIYNFLQRNGFMIIMFLADLIQLKIPKISFGKMGLETYCKTIIVLFFLMSFFNKVTGIVLLDSFKESLNKTKETEPSSGSSGSSEPSGSSGSSDFSEKEPQPMKTGGAINMKSMANKAFETFKPKPTGEKEEEEGEQSWLTWLMNPLPGIFMFVIKCIALIIFWLFKFIISLGMVGLSSFIFVIYFIWNLLFGMSSFTTPIQSVSSKIDLMYRIMYTKLCDNDNDGIFKYIAKSMIFFCIYFLVEIIIVRNLMQSVDVFSNMKTPSYGNSNNNTSVKSFMVILYAILILCVAIWSTYKFKFQMPIIVSAYKNRKTPDDTLDKRFQYECSTNGIYEEESKNSFLNILMNSDRINKMFIDEFNAKTEGIKPPSSMSSFINKIGEYSDKVKEMGNSLKDSVSNMFTSKRNRTSD